MSMRSWILLVLVAIVGVGSLSGCQGVENTKKGPTRQKTT